MPRSTRSFSAITLTVIAVTLSCASTMPAATLYSEAITGDLANINVPATVIGTTGVGSNLVIGSMFDDTDAFAFTIPQGQQLTRVTLTSYTGSFGPNFYLHEAPQYYGPTVGFTYFDQSRVGADLFGFPVGFGDFATGYSYPLCAGTYVADLRSINYPLTANYTLNFETSLVPEPSVTALAAVSVLALRRRGRVG